MSLNISIAPLELTLNATIAQLMSKLMPADGSITYANATLTGDPRCAATFTGGNLTIPDKASFPNDGLVLGTGDAFHLTNQDGTETGTVFGTPGDNQIYTALGSASYDACSLEFEFKCSDITANTLIIDYVFASDEYNEQVAEGLGFVDSFALLVNGVNVANIPNTIEPVNVYNVNKNKNSEYFVVNDPRPEKGTYQYFEPDGFTNGLSTETPIVPLGGWNKMKVGIADVTDAEIDSWVFLKGSSGGGFQCVNVPPPPTQTPTEIVFTPDNPGSHGDPHFTTFDGQFFSYHGQCDLVLARSQSFASGLGLNVHIRTKRAKKNHIEYSYITGAAVKIGDDIIEVNETGDLIVNGEENTPGSAGLVFGGLHSLTKSIKGKKHCITVYDLDLGDNKSVQIRANTKNGMMMVDINGHFTDSEGLLGGNRMGGNGLFARDGTTDMTGNWNSFGEEWQVNDIDPKLFKDSDRHPQYPYGCSYEVDDDETKKSSIRGRRRLTEAKPVTVEDAARVCSHLIGQKREFCINDIVATGDLDLVEDPFYAASD